MKKNEEKNKKGKKWINVLIVVLALFFGFIIGINLMLELYLDADKLNEICEGIEKDNKETKSEDYNEIEIDDKISKLYKYIPDLNSNYVRLTAYQNKKITLADLDNAYLLAYAASNLDLDDTDKKPFDGMELDPDWYSYDASLLQNKVQEMYGKTLENESYEIGFGKECEYVNNNYQCSLGGGSTESMESIKYISKFYEESGNLYIEDKYMIIIYRDNVNTLYEDSTKTKLIASLDENNTEESESLAKKYDSKMKKYIHTFKKNENGSYYWYSTEPIE